MRVSGIVEGVNPPWNNFPAVRRTRKDADLVGDCVVFNMKDNDARLITYINYEMGTVTVLAKFAVGRLSMKKSRGTERRGPREIITAASGSGPRVARETSSHQADFFHQLDDDLWGRLDRFEKVLTTFTGFSVLNAICREQVARNASLHFIRC